MKRIGRVLFLITLLTIGFLGLIIFWPKITPKKPPSSIKEAQDFIGKVPFGGEILEAVGEGEKTEEPVLGEETSSSPTPTPKNIIEKTKDLLLEKVEEELTKKFRQLPLESQEKIKEQICQ